MLHSAFGIRSIQVPPNVNACASLWVKVKLVDRYILVHKRLIIGTAYKNVDPRHFCVCKLSRGGTVIPKELINFLKQLPNGQLEIAYENLTYQKECISEPTPSTLTSKEDMVSLLCSFPYLELLNELIEYETSDGHSLQCELGILYQKCSCIESEQALFHSLLRKHHSYGYRMELFEDFSQSIDWLEEPFERIVGVLAQQNVGFLLETNRTWSDPFFAIEVRASEDVSLTELQLFAYLAKYKYSADFEAEYCQHTYQTVHYEHPIRLFFDTYAPVNEELLPDWNQALNDLCSQDASCRVRGSELLLEVVSRSSSMQESLSLFVSDDCIEPPETYPLFERELCSSKSLLSALWLYTYLDIDSPKTLTLAKKWGSADYEDLMKPIRALFNPIFDCVQTQQMQNRTFESTE